MASHMKNIVLRSLSIHSGITRTTLDFVARLFDTLIPLRSLSPWLVDAPLIPNTKSTLKIVKKGPIHPRPEIDYPHDLKAKRSKNKPGTEGRGAPYPTANETHCAEGRHTATDVDGSPDTLDHLCTDEKKALDTTDHRVESGSPNKESR